MYGMVNEAVKGLVLSAFGKDAWEKIHTQANSPGLLCLSTAMTTP